MKEKMPPLAAELAIVSLPPLKFAIVLKTVVTVQITIIKLRAVMHGILNSC